MKYKKYKISIIASIGVLLFAGIVFSAREMVEKTVPAHVDNLESKGYTSPMNTQTIEIKGGETVVFGDISIKSTPMGHKWMTDGTEASFVQLDVTAGGKAIVDTLYEGDSMTIEHYTIKAVQMGSNGESVRLEVRDTRAPSEVSASGTVQTVTIKGGDTATVFDLTLTNKSGGHKFLDSGKDSSWVNLEIATPRKSKFFYLNNFANLNNNPDADITFDTYTVRVDKVSFDASEVVLTITKK
jgi:hypothetical protein